MSYTSQIKGSTGSTELMYRDVSVGDCFSYGDVPYKKSWDDDLQVARDIDITDLSISESLVPDAMVKLIQVKSEYEVKYV